MQMAHQHGRGYTLAGDIAQKEQEVPGAAFSGYQVAIIAAHGARRLVVEIDLPVAYAQVLLRQQGALDARGQVEVVLERALLVGGQVVEAVSCEGIGLKFVGCGGVSPRERPPDWIREGGCRLQRKQAQTAGRDPRAAACA